MSVIEPVRSARHRGATRDPTRIASALPQSTAWSIAVSAPSGRMSAKANGLVEPVLARAGLRDPRERLHGAARADLDPVVAVGRDRRARRGVVLGRRHEHPAVGELHREQLAVAQAREEPADDRADRAGVPARILDDVLRT